MPLPRKNAAIPALATKDRSSLTPYGGLLLLEALCRRWRLWEKVHDAFPQPFAAQQNLAQLLYSIAVGGTSLRDAGLLQDESSWLRVLGLKQTADEAALHTWLHSQTDGGAALRKLNSWLVAMALQELSPILEGVTNSIDVVMTTRQSEVVLSRGTLASFTWRTLSVGDFLVDGVWRDARNDNAAANCAELLRTHQSLWQNRHSHFYATDIPAPAEWRSLMQTSGFVTWSAQVAYTTLQFNPELARLRWVEAAPDDPLARRYGLLYPSLELARQIPGVAAIGLDADGDAYSAGNRVLALPPASQAPVQTYFAKHFLRTFVADQLLLDFAVGRSLHLPEPVRDGYCAVACFAYNLLTALRLLLFSRCNGWTARDVVRAVMLTPASISSPGHRTVLRLGASQHWPEEWRDFVSHSMRRERQSVRIVAGDASESGDGNNSRS